MVFKSVISAVAAGLAVVSLNVNAIPMYEYAGGDIVGVTGLDINGTLWDMELHDGSFSALYAAVGSTALYDGPFAQDASYALLTYTNTLADNAEDFLGCTYPAMCLIATVS